MQGYWVYILASKTHGTLYIGVTNDIVRRVGEHRGRAGSKFTSRYSVTRLVYCELFHDIHAAIQREKTLKHYNRAWKIDLIERDSPQWLDLYPSVLPIPGSH